MSDFEFYCGGYGWIEGTIKIGDKVYYISYSYITNFLDDLLKAVLAVKNILPQDEGYETFWATYEPVTDEWTLEIKNDKLYFTIVTYTDWDKEIIEGTSKSYCDTDEFIHNLCKALTDFIKKFGLFGYRDNWSLEFPLSLYIQLLKLDKYQTALTTSVIRKEDNYGISAKATSIEKEINEVLSVINQ